MFNLGEEVSGDTPLSDLIFETYFSLSVLSLFNNLSQRTRDQFECDVTWFCFCFDSHARCGCCSIVCLRFQVKQIKQVD